MPRSFAALTHSECTGPSTRNVISMVNMYYTDVLQCQAVLISALVKHNWLVRIILAIVHAKILRGSCHVGN